MNENRTSRRSVKFENLKRPRAPIDHKTHEKVYRGSYKGFSEMRDKLTLVFRKRESVTQVFGVIRVKAMI